MAELLVRTADDGPSLRGDVIVALPDGWAWSEAERDASHWRILAVPGLPDEEAIALTAPGRTPPGSGLVAPSRHFYLDLDALGRARTPDRVRSARRVRDPQPDPRHIGPNRRVIG